MKSKKVLGSLGLIDTGAKLMDLLRKRTGHDEHARSKRARWAMETDRDKEASDSLIEDF